MGDHHGGSGMMSVQGIDIILVLGILLFVAVIALVIINLILLYTREDRNTHSKKSTQSQIMKQQTNTRYQRPYRAEQYQEFQRVDSIRKQSFEEKANYCHKCGQQYSDKNDYYYCTRCGSKID